MQCVNCKAEHIKLKKTSCQSQLLQNCWKVQEKTLFVEKIHLPFKKEIIQVTSLVDLQKITNMKESFTGKKQWTPQEEQLLFKLHLQYGNKWSVISTHIPGHKHDTHVKNKFYSTLRKGFRKMNKYITNVRRKIYKSQNAVNKLLKPDFLTKLAAVADRNYLQKYEVKQKAIDISQSLQQKLIELSKNSDDYQKNDSRNFTFQQLLLAQIQQFNRNCKKRKGKRKTKAETKRSELFQSKSIYQSQMLDEQSQKDQVCEVSYQRQENQQRQIKKQKEEGANKDMEVKVLPQVCKQTIDKNNHFPIQDQLNFNAYLKNQQNNDNNSTPYLQAIKTPYSTHGSLLNLINPSPLNGSRGNFHQAFLNFPTKMQNSSQIFKNSQTSMNLKSTGGKQKSELNFLQKIPMASNSNSLIYTSAQICRISQADNQERQSMIKKLSSSQNYDEQRSFSIFRKAEVEVVNIKIYHPKIGKKVSTIDQQKQYLQQKQLQQSERNKE